MFSSLTISKRRGYKMKIIRRRKPSIKTALGITKAKRTISRATGIPTTKSGIKRKAENVITGGAYGKYERTLAAVNRPFKYAKRPPSCLGFILSIFFQIFGLVFLIIWLLNIFIYVQKRVDTHPLFLTFLKQCFHIDSNLPRTKLILAPLYTENVYILFPRMLPSSIPESPPAATPMSTSIKYPIQEIFCWVSKA